MDNEKVLLEIAQICVDTIPLWEEKESIALYNMDVWRCPLYMASSLHDEIFNVIEDYAFDNDIDADEIDPEDVFWAVGKLDKVSD